MFGNVKKLAGNIDEVLFFADLFDVANAIT